MNSDAAKLAQLTERIGLTNYGARAYVTLIQRGPLLVKELAAAVACSDEDILSSIDLPVAIGLVARTQRKGRLLFYATDPDLAFLSLTAHLVWRSKASLAPIRELPPTDSADVERTRTLYSQMAVLARRLYRPQRSAGMHREFDAETPEDLAQLTTEIISLATTRIRAVSRSPRLPHVSTFWSALTERLAAGVTYTRIVDLQEFVDHGLLIKQRDITETGVRLFLIEQERLAQSFYVVDSRYLSTTHAAGDASAYHGVGRITTHHRVIERYGKRFDKLLGDAIPGHFVVDEMLRAASALMKSARDVLDTAELPWLQSLVDWGEFSTYAKGVGWSRDQVADVEKRAITAGLVHRNSSRHPGPAYPIDEAQIRAAFHRTSLG